MWTFLQGSNIGIGLFLLLFNRSLCGNIQWWITTRCWWISHMESHFKLDRESHWARRSNAMSRHIQQSWPITRKNRCLCILLWTPFECRQSTRNCWDENRWFAFRVPSNRVADRMLDYIATVNCSKSYSGGEAQWNFLSFESRFGVWCKQCSVVYVQKIQWPKIKRVLQQATIIEDLAIWNHWMIQPRMHVYQIDYTTSICKYELIIL